MDIDNKFNGKHEEEKKVTLDDFLKSPKPEQGLIKIIVTLKNEIDFSTTMEVMGLDNSLTASVLMDQLILVLGTVSRDHTCGDQNCQAKLKAETVINFLRGVE